MFGLEMIIAAVEVAGMAVLIWAALKIRDYTRAQEKEDERIQKEWANLADRYEELAKHAEALSGAATAMEARERLRAMSVGYAEIGPIDPSKVN
jgi:threonine/homoserine/homoserine lactone efflux protein